MKPLFDRFSTKYRISPATGCWIWTGSVNTSGYGTITKKAGSVAYAHRVSYELFNGTIPSGMSVCHTCDEKTCVNPDHLFLGSTKDNVRDSISKNRWTRLFTEDQINEIKRRYKEQRTTQTQIARELGVSVSTIHLIVNDKSYA